MAKGKQVITERDILQAHQNQRTEFIVPAGTLITPAAVDAAKARGIKLKREGAAQATSAPSLPPPSPPPSLSSRIAIGSDHGGYALKESLKTFLRELGFHYEDVGTFSEASVDYPDIAEKVAEQVASGSASCGIMIDGAGVGSAMAANKVPGIRAAACYDTYTARNSREHNNANILVLGSRNLGIDIAKEIVKVWLNTGFGGGRHLRRVEKIAEIEKKYSRTG